MSLDNLQAKKLYIIKEIAIDNNQDLVELYEQGIIEGEIVEPSADVKTSKKIILVKISGQMFAFNRELAKNIIVEEYHG